MEFYLALQDEVWRFVYAIQHLGARPTIYRQGKTYQIFDAELALGTLWFRCFELYWQPPFVHVRIPLVHQVEYYCISEVEWHQLLAQTGVRRNPYFQQGPDTEPISAVAVNSTEKSLTKCIE